MCCDRAFVLTKLELILKNTCLLMLEIKLIRFIASSESNVISCLFLNILFDTCKRLQKHVI